MNLKQFSPAQLSIASITVLILVTFWGALPMRAQGLQDTPPSSAPPSDKLPAILNNVRYEQKLDSQIPLNLSFRDENGQPVHLSDYFGRKPVVLILAYYRCPMLCSQVLAGAAHAFKQLQFRIGKQYNVLTVSFDPREPPDLAASTKQTYLKQYGNPDAAGGWHFLTGQQPEIDALTKAVGFHYNYDAKTGQYAHASGIVVATPAGKVAQYFYGIDYPVQDLRLALVQSSQEKIGSLVDEIALYCCRYDPNTGRYTALIGRVLQIAGAFTLLIFGGVLFLLFRLDARKRKELEAAAARRDTVLPAR